MKLALLLISIISLLSGLVLRFIAKQNRTEMGKSIHWYQVQYWFMPWKAVDILTPKGMKLSVTSVALLVIGVVLYGIALGLH